MKRPNSPWRHDLSLPGSPHFSRRQEVAVHPAADCSAIHAAVEIAIAARRVLAVTIRCACGTILRRGNVTSGKCDACRVGKPARPHVEARPDGVEFKSWSCQ